MKTLLTLFSILLLPLGAWAGSDHAKSPIPNLTVCQPSHDCGQEPLVYRSERSCLAKMEEAMKAMEPYIHHSLGVITTTTEICEDECYHLREIERIKQKRKVYEQWATVKRECWRATGSPGTP